LFRHARCYTQAATYQASDNPMESVLLSIVLGQEKRLDALERALHIAEDSDAATGMDSRPLPIPTGDEAVADGAKPETPPAD
jgi:hypothetical protein